jgi:hypothetical protein
LFLFSLETRHIVWAKVFDDWLLDDFVLTKRLVVAVKSVKEASSIFLRDQSKALSEITKNLASLFVWTAIQELKAVHANRRIHIDNLFAALVHRLVRPVSEVASNEDLPTGIQMVKELVAPIIIG